MKKTSFVAAAAVSFVAIAACSTIADLDIAYSEGDAAPVVEAGRRPVRDSSFEGAVRVERPASAVSGQLPCFDAPDASCDMSEGLGCCIVSGTSKCIFHHEAQARCAGGVFVGCREDHPDSPCCWRTIGGVKQALHAADCADNLHACVVSDGGSSCPGTACRERDCDVGDGGVFKIGACGVEPTCVP